MLLCASFQHRFECSGVSTLFSSSGGAVSELGCRKPLVSQQPLLQGLHLSREQNRMGIEQVNDEKVLARVEVR